MRRSGRKEGGDEVALAGTGSKEEQSTLAFPVVAQLSKAQAEGRGGCTHMLQCKRSVKRQAMKQTYTETCGVDAGVDGEVLEDEDVGRCVVALAQVTSGASSGGTSVCNLRILCVH